LPWAKLPLTIQILKKSSCQKIDDLGRFWASISVFFFTCLWPSEGIRRPNRAAVTPIGQQNPLGPLKLLGLREKPAKNTDFDFAQITLNILVYQCTSVCGGRPECNASWWQ
jgi:hypothetical protein